MKSLFVKQKMCYGGPWASFKYDEMSTVDAPRKILAKTYAKGGHPFPMINLLRMDCIVLDLDIRYDWLNTAMGLNPYLEKVLLSHHTGLTKLEDVDFSKYDLVYSEDPIIPQHIILDNPNTVFAFNYVEHTQVSPPGAYDLLFWHVKGFQHGWPQAVTAQFPQAPEVMRKAFKGKGKKIHIEYRTVELKESGLTAHAYLEKRTGLQCTYNGVAHKVSYLVENPPKSAESYWERLGDSKYNVMLPAAQGLRVGQGLGDAASMGVINIGNAGHLDYIHPRCRAENLRDAQHIIRDIETTGPDLAQQIIEYQDAAIKKTNERFLNIIIDTVNKKRGL